MDQPLVGYSQLYVTPDIKKVTYFILILISVFEFYLMLICSILKEGICNPRAYVVFEQDHPYDRIYVEQDSKSKNKYQLYFEDIDGKYIFDGSSCGYFSAVTWSVTKSSFKGWTLHPVSDEEVQKTFDEQQFAKSVAQMVLNDF